MSLLELLGRALALANEGHASIPEVEALKQKAEKAEAALALAEGWVVAYEEARNRFRLEEGDPVARKAWWVEHRLLVQARFQVRRLREDLDFIQEEVERQWAHATYRKAAEQKGQGQA